MKDAAAAVAAAHFDDDSDEDDQHPHNLDRGAGSHQQGIGAVESSGSTDEEMRKLLQPVPTEEQLLQMLRQYYCTSPTKENDDDRTGNPTAQGCNAENNTSVVRIIKPLDSYDDANFLVQIQGTEYLLKIHNGVESKDFLDTRAEAMASTKLQRDAGNDDDDDFPFYTKGHMKSVIHLQNAMMELLQEHDVPTSVPIPPHRSRKSGTGVANGSSSSSPPCPVLIAEFPVVSAAHSPCRCVVRLLSWLPGRTLASLPFMALETLGDAGRFLGNMDKVLDILSPNSLRGALNSVGSSMAVLRRGSALNLHYMKEDLSILKNLEIIQQAEESKKEMRDGAPHRHKSSVRQAFLDESLLVPSQRYHQWDGKNSCDLRKFVHCIDDSRRRDLVLSVIDAFERELVDTGIASQFRRGVIHGDFNDANIIVDTHEMKIAGVIDFGDSVER